MGKVVFKENPMNLPPPAQRGFLRVGLSIGKAEELLNNLHRYQVQDGWALVYEKSVERRDPYIRLKNKYRNNCPTGKHHWLPYLMVIRWQAFKLPKFNINGVNIYHSSYDKRGTWGWVYLEQVREWLRQVQAVPPEALRYAGIAAKRTGKRYTNARNELLTPGLRRHWSKPGRHYYTRGFQDAMNECLSPPAPKFPYNDLHYYQRGWVSGQVYKIRPEIINKMPEKWDGVIGRTLELPENKALTDHLVQRFGDFVLNGGRNRTTIPEHFRKIMDFIIKNPDCTQNQVIAGVGVTRRPINEHMKQMEQQGLIYKAGFHMTGRRKNTKEALWRLSCSSSAALTGQPPGSMTSSAPPANESTPAPSAGPSSAPAAPTSSTDQPCPSATSATPTK